MGVYGHKMNHLESVTVRDKTNYDGTIGQLWHPSGKAKLSNEHNEFVSFEEIETAYSLLEEMTDYDVERVEEHYLYLIDKNTHGTIIGYSFDRMSDRQTLGHKKDRVHISPAAFISTEGLLTPVDKWEIQEDFA